jgi:flagellar hook-associated protein 1
MSLIGALNIGRNALAVQQAALQVTTNNIANVGNPNYSRQTGQLRPGADQEIRQGIFMGTGVNLVAINRNIDNALLQRLRSAISDNTAADSNQAWQSRVEAVFNALGPNGLSSQMSQFFNSWSKVAGAPQDIGLRQIVLTQGGTLSRTFNDIQKQLGGLRSDIDNRLTAQVAEADDITRQIAELNGRITVAEGGQSGEANGLRDQRDGLVRQLSELVDVGVTEDKGSLNVFIGSQPLVIGTMSRGLTLKQTSTGGQSVTTEVAFRDDPNVVITVQGGQIGGLMSARAASGETGDRLDKLAGAMIHELNKLHSSGQGLVGLTGVTAGNAVRDPLARLDSTAAGLDFPPKNGSFVVTVTNKSTGLATSRLIKVDLAPGAAAPTTLASLAAAINDPSITATVAGGQLSLAAVSSDSTISFSQDTSGVLASLGINSFFSGKDASSIGVSAPVAADPRMLAAAGNLSPGDNSMALAIAGLDSRSLDALGGLSLTQTYDTLVTTVASSVSASKTIAEGSAVVRETLEAQREALSGVSLDEESVNLIKQQRAFEGAARIISTVDEMLQTVLNLVR